MTKQPYILNIGGFDSSNGAGITADVKTFSDLNTYGLSVQTCLTIQNESEIRKIYWFTIEQIKEQIDVLVDQYEIEYAKLSLTNGLKNALEIVEYIHKVCDAKIIWDPIMKSSSGYNFIRGINGELLDAILSKVYLATPNWNEIDRWEEKYKPLATGSRKSRITNIYLKGGHNKENIGLDYLFLNTGKIEKIKPNEISKQEKHGSGCVFASALTAYLALGDSLLEASKKAKEYIYDFLESNNSLLGYHSLARPERFPKPFRSEKLKPFRSEKPKPEKISTRLESSGLYHIFNRGNNQENIFIEEENYIYFRSLIGRHILPVADVYAYCLLPNHFHLVVKMKGENELDSNQLANLSQPFSNLFNAYSKAFNKLNNRIGSLFQKPFRRKLIEDDSYLINCIIYVHTNPSHHDLCDYEEYQYSSYQTILNGNDVLVESGNCIDLFEGRENFIEMHKQKVELISGEFKT